MSKFQILNRTFAYYNDDLSNMDKERMGAFNHPKNKSKQVRFVRLIDRIYFNVSDLLSPYIIKKMTLRSIFAPALPPEWRKDMSKLWMSNQSWLAIEAGIKSGKKKAELSKLLAQGKLI